MILTPRKLAFGTIFLINISMNNTAMAIDNCEEFSGSHSNINFNLDSFRERWRFTFPLGDKFPGKVVDGANFLSNNGEAQIYIPPTSFYSSADKNNEDFRAFNITPEGLRISAAKLSEKQRSKYSATKFRFFGSGILTSKFAFMHGIVKVRAKLPSAPGSWPAIWLLPESGKWPPEIDILEGMNWGKHQSSMHAGVIDDKGSAQNFGKWFPLQADPSKGFHDYGLKWEANKVIISFDGKIILERVVSDRFNQPMYLLINLAVGGKWPYNELNIGETDSMAEDRLKEGAERIAQYYPDQFVIESIVVRDLDKDAADSACPSRNTARGK